MYDTTETENIGKAHISAAHRMLEELDKSLKDFREQQREIRKKVIIVLYVCLLLSCIQDLRVMVHCCIIVV